MEPLLVALALVLLVAPLVLAVVALLRTRGVDRLHRRVEGLERELDRLHAAASGEAAAASGEPDGADPDAWSSAAPSAAPAPPDVARAPRRAGAPASPASRPAAPRPAPAEPVRAPRERPRVEWERWLGVRGAAALGGVVLALAGVLFFQYAVEHGLLGPRTRLALGTLAGLGAWGGAALLRPRGFRATANALDGAGAVLLYATLWAAHALFELIPFAAAFGGMALVTAACSALALRHRSQLVAVLGLVGGFATPLLLGRTENPIGLFGYLLLVDLGFLLVGRRRRWPALGVIAVVGTTAFQALWVLTQLGAEEGPLGLALLGLFGVLFALTSGAALADERRRAWLVTQGAGLLLPFVLALWFAARVELGPHLWPLGLLAATLLAAAAWSERHQGLPGVVAGAGAGAAGLVLVWALSREPVGALAWELAGTTAGLGAVALGALELAARRRGAEPAPPTGLGREVTGVLAVLAAVLAASGVPVELAGATPWLVGAAALAAALLRAGLLSGAPGRLWLAGAAYGAPVALLAALGRPDEVGRWTLFAWAAAGVAAPAALGAWLGRGRRARDAAGSGGDAGASPVSGRGPDAARRGAWDAALVAGLLALAALPLGPVFARGPAAGLVAASAALGLGAAALGAARASGARVALALAVLALAQPLAVGGGRPDVPGAAVLALLGATVAAALALPLALRRRLADAPAAWIAAAAVAVAWWPAVARALPAPLAEHAPGLAPALLAALAGAAALALARLGPALGRAARAAELALPIAALVLASAALPVQLEHRWPTVAAALFAAGLAALDRRRAEPALAVAAALFAAAAAARLGLLALTPAALPRSPWPIAGWIGWIYLVPAAAALATARLVARTPAAEPAAPRGSARVAALTDRGRLAGLAGLAGAACVFAWLNLAILERFAPPDAERIVVAAGRVPARDLALSIAWAAYALCLLGVGLARKSAGPRWLSLGLLLLTLAKVVLHDLGELEGLWRVGSLVGLALALLLVSVLYQRLVLGEAAALDGRRGQGHDPAPPSGGPPQRGAPR